MSLKKYFTEEERLEAKRLRNKKWADANPLKVKEMRDNYLKNNPMKKKETDKKSGKKYRDANKAKRKVYLESIKEEAEAYQKAYRKTNLDKLKDYKKGWYLANNEKVNKRVTAYKKQRKLIDPLFKLTCNLRIMVGRAIKRNGCIKNSKTEQILGCSYKNFKEYLESKFEAWMNWENYGKYNGEFNYGWDIDHIIPLRSAKSEEDVIKLNHYSNLQPLCSKVNRDIKK